MTKKDYNYTKLVIPIKEKEDVELWQEFKYYKTLVEGVDDEWESIKLFVKEYIRYCKERAEWISGGKRE
jgi:hypothetical protein